MGEAMDEKLRVFELVCGRCNVVVKVIECPEDDATEALVYLEQPAVRCTLCGEWPTLRRVAPPTE
jgi:hypothetical protein